MEQVYSDIDELQRINFKNITIRCFDNNIHLEDINLVGNIERSLTHFKLS